MLYLLFGQDDFSLQEKFTNLRRGWGDEESLSINTSRFNAKQITPEQLISTCDSLPFLGQYRLVIVEGLLSYLDQKKSRQGSSSNSKNDWKPLVQYIDRMPDSTILVFIDGKIDRKTALAKTLTSKGTVYTFPPLKGVKLQNWIRSRVAKVGGSISTQAIRLLTELAGENLWMLSNEIEKLNLYTAGKTIEAEDVHKITGYTRETSIFTMVDAIIERRSSNAIHLSHRLLTEGMAPAYLLYMITRQLRLMVQTKVLARQKIPPPEIQNRLGLSYSYPTDKLLDETARYPMERLIDIYNKLLETDVSIKTGKWKDDFALDLLLTELCSST